MITKVQGTILVANHFYIHIIYMLGDYQIILSSEIMQLCNKSYCSQLHHLLALIFISAMTTAVTTKDRNIFNIVRTLCNN